MHTEEIEYEAGGLTCIGHLALDDGLSGSRPGVLVCHEGPGLSDHARNVADRLAGLGYVAFALDYHGGGKVLPRDEMMPKLGALMGDPDRIKLLGTAGLDVLRRQPTVDASRVAAIGFCFGGTMALELARGGAALRAVVGFHSGLQTSHPQDAVNIVGSVLVQIGAEDPLIPAQQRTEFEAEMRAGGVDWRMVVYGGAEHSFTNVQADSFGMPGVKYHELTDKRSWRAMIDFFDETF